MIVHFSDPFDVFIPILFIICIVSFFCGIFFMAINKDFGANIGFGLFCISLVVLLMLVSSSKETRVNEIYQVMAVEHSINIDKDNIMENYKAGVGVESLFVDNSGVYYVGKNNGGGEFAIQVANQNQE